MRLLACFACVCALGCAAAPDSDEPVKSGPDAPLPPDLRTRTDGDDWPRFLGPTGDSVSAETGVAPWPKEGPRVVWTKPLKDGYGAPAVSRGRLFVFDRVANRMRLRCLKSETGESLWQQDYPTDYQDLYSYSPGPRCSPVVDRDRVYTCGPEGMLYCRRAEDGKEIWKVDTKAKFGFVQNFFGVGCSPAVEGDLLITQVGGSPAGTTEKRPTLDLKGDDSGVVAFDKYTGEVKYHVTDELASYSSPVLATIGGRRWCFVFARNGLIGLEPGTGKVDFHYRWRAEKELESVNASNPVVVGDRVFISETYGPRAGSALLEVKPGECKEVWTDAEKAPREKSMQCHWNTPIYVDGYLYGCSGRHPDNADLRCVELATGKVKWREKGMTRTSLLLVDGRFVCLAEDGVVRLLKVNPDKYEEESRAELFERGKDGKPDPDAPLLKEPCWAAPVLSHGLMYVRGADRLVCLELIPAPKK
jgi:outer membrane protein assembly factor BamB